MNKKIWEEQKQKRKDNTNNESKNPKVPKWTIEEVNKKSKNLIQNISTSGEKKPIFWPYTNWNEWMKTKEKHKTNEQLIEEHRLKRKT